MKVIWLPSNQGDFQEAFQGGWGSVTYEGGLRYHAKGLPCEINNHTRVRAGRWGSLSLGSPFLTHDPNDQESPFGHWGSLRSGAWALGYSSLMIPPWHWYMLQKYCSILVIPIDHGQPYRSEHLLDCQGDMMQYGLGNRIWCMMEKTDKPLWWIRIPERLWVTCLADFLFFNSIFFQDSWSVSNLKWILRDLYYPFNVDDFALLS